MRRTLTLLEDKVVELKIVERASDNTTGRVLRKNVLKPRLNDQWVIPPDGNAALEDVLEVYHRPRDPACPLVRLDETSKQLIKETRPARTDYECERNGPGLI
jgi:hypothetical protein